MATAALNRYTPEEYLALERNAEFRSEYIDGRIIAMTGGSPEHADIVLNLGTALRAQLRPRGCRVFVNDVRARVDRPAGYVYPDVMAVCGEAVFADTVPRTLLNPNLIIEVLSDSTQAIDRGDKLKLYRQIETLQEYVLVAQDRVAVERYVRRGDFWVYSDETDLEAVVELTSIDCTIPMRDVYADVEFPSTGEEER